MLETSARAYIRRPTTKDEKFLIELAIRSRSLHRPWSYPPDTPSKYRAYLNRLRSGTSAGFLICRATDKTIAGIVNVNNIERGLFWSGALGYHAFLPLAGKGYMSEGLEMVLQHAFKTMRLHRLEANIQPGNRASIELAKRCNFEKEGLSPRFLKIGGKWQDHERWALLRENWPARKQGKRQVSRENARCPKK